MLGEAMVTVEGLIFELSQLRQQLAEIDGEAEMFASQAEDDLMRALDVLMEQQQ